MTNVPVTKKTRKKNAASGRPRKPPTASVTHVVPHLVVAGAEEAIDFYVRAFGAEEVERMPAPDGRILHAELRFGDATLYLCDAFGDAVRPPRDFGGSPVTIHLWVDDVDAAFERAVEAGAHVFMPVTDTFWGDRYGKLRDPFGHEWGLATKTESLTKEEIRARAEEFFAEAALA